MTAHHDQRSPDKYKVRGRLRMFGNTSDSRLDFFPQQQIMRTWMSMEVTN